MKLKLLLIALVSSTLYLKASPPLSLNDSTEITSNATPTGIGNANNKDTNDVARGDVNYVTGRDTNNVEANDTSAEPQKKKDKRGVFSVTLGWQDMYEYLGSYYTTNYNYGYAELRYKFWFGLFGAIAPQFLFNTNSFYYVGSNLTVGFDNQWFRNFHVSFSYTYCAHQESSIRTLQDLFSNDFDVYAYYVNKIITPEIRYDLTFGDVTGLSLRNLSSPSRISVLGGDNVINVGLSHTFIVFKSKHHGSISIKIGDNANFGTANALLTRRVIEPDATTGNQYVDVPYTGDKFGALDNETNLTIYLSWHFISVNPYINFSVPFKNIAAEQAALGVVNVNGTVETPAPDIVSKPLFYGGVSLILKFPWRERH